MRSKIDIVFESFEYYVDKTIVEAIKDVPDTFFSTHIGNGDISISIWNGHKVANRHRVEKSYNNTYVTYIDLSTEEMALIESKLTIWNWLINISRRYYENIKNEEFT